MAAREPLGDSALRAPALGDGRTLEEAVRGLFRCHRQRGDRGAVLREERRLRAALERAYAGDDPDLCRPSLETAEVFEDVLAELSAPSGSNGKGAGNQVTSTRGLLAR